MKLKRPLPKNRTYEQLKNHYLVEKEIAERIKKADPEQRKKIFATMYDELFEKVPDHSRLTIRDTASLTEKSNQSKYKLLSGLITPEIVFAEFAPGDCKFSLAISSKVKQVYGIDISDQKNPEDKEPENFKLIIYDGYNLSEIKEQSIDVLFSDQLIEHFHPDETKPHFELARKMLKQKGKYLFRTPHYQSGPYDISMYFSDEPEGFHLKEWTYTEIYKLLKDSGFRKVKSYWFAKNIKLRLPNIYFITIEFILSLFPKRKIRKISKLAMPCIACMAIK